MTELNAWVIVGVIVGAGMMVYALVRAYQKVSIFCPVCHTYQRAYLGITACSHCHCVLLVSGSNKAETI